MAVGDDATNAGFSLVPDTGVEDAKVRYGAREINRTRDFIAQVKKLIPNIWPISAGGTGASSQTGALNNLGITWGTASPSGGVDGNVYLKIIQ